MNTDNKQIITAAMHELFDNADAEAAARFLRDDFVDHGPGIIASSKAEWVAAARQIPVADMKLQVRHLLVDGEYVIMLSRRWLPWQQEWIAVFDLWRIRDGLVIEHGEVFQPIADGDHQPDPHSLMPW